MTENEARVTKNEAPESPPTLQVMVGYHTDQNQWPLAGSTVILHHLHPETPADVAARLMAGGGQRLAEFLARQCDRRFLGPLVETLTELMEKADGV